MALAVDNVYISTLLLVQQVDSVKKLAYKRLGVGATGAKEESLLLFDPLRRFGCELNVRRMVVNECSGTLERETQQLTPSAIEDGSLSSCLVSCRLCDVIKSP